MNTTKRSITSPSLGAVGRVPHKLWQCSDSRLRKHAKNALDAVVCIGGAYLLCAFGQEAIAGESRPQQAGRAFVKRA